jgi:hypothetical protein
LPTVLIGGTLRINNNAGNVRLYQATSLNSSSIFTLQGSGNLITTAINILSLDETTLNAASSLTGSCRTGTGFVDGPLARVFSTTSQTRVFDVGSGIAGYGGLILSPNIIATYTATVFNGDHADVSSGGCMAGVNGAASVNAYWTIKSSSAVSSAIANASVFNYASLSQETMSSPIIRQNTTTTGVAANWTTVSSSPSNANIDIPTNAFTGYYIIGDAAATTTPSASISSDEGSGVCAGTTITFTATGTNVTGSGTTSYAWYKNGSPIGGAIANTYSSSILANGDQIYCIITSGYQCSTVPTATSNTITVKILTSAIWTGVASAGSQTAWDNPLNWNTGQIPISCMDVIIPTGLANYPILTSAVLIANAKVKSVTIQTGANVNIASGTLVLAATTGLNAITIDAGGILTNSGTINVTNGATFINNGTYNHNTTQTDLFTNAVESFSATSNLVITNWHNYTIPLATNFSGTFGNVEINTGNSDGTTAGTNWVQNGLFRTNAIVGKLTIKDAWLTLDNLNTAGNTVIGAIELNHADALLWGHDKAFSVAACSLTVANTFKITKGLFEGVSTFTTTLGLNTVSQTYQIIADSIRVDGGIFSGTDSYKYAGGAVNAANIYVNANTLYLSGGEFSGLKNQNGNFVFTSYNKIKITGGTFVGAYKSASTQSATGNVTITASSVDIQGGVMEITTDGGTAALTTGSFSQSGGVFQLFKGYLADANSVTCTVNGTSGSFTQSGGNFIFDDLASTGVRTLFIATPTYNLSGGNMVFTGAAATTKGLINFNRSGTITFTRSGTHDIQGIKQIITSPAIVDIASGNLQIASNATASLTMLTVDAGATLNLRANSVYSNATLANTGITVNGTVKLANINGLYNNTNTAGFSNIGALDFALAATSIIEYNGSINQILTGSGIGSATAGAAQYKYGNLTINTLGAACAYTLSSAGTPTVRGTLTLAAGELNLSGNANQSSVTTRVTTGRSIVIENPAIGAIIRGTGFIRSENDGQTGTVKWFMGNTTGAHVIPFAFSSATSDYIPFTFDLKSGTVDTVGLSTYQTDAAHSVLPPTVTSLVDTTTNHAMNEANVVKRFWQIDKTGSSGTADITFSYANAENPLNGDDEMRAQRWIGNGWQSTSTVGLGYGTITQSTAPIAGIVTVKGVSLFSPWTLVRKGKPLPIKLLSFKAVLKDKKVHLDWITITEKNNSYFEVQRSGVDALNFETIETITGSGNSTSLRNYHIVDARPLLGISYYRIKQIDHDGKYSYMGLAPISLDKEIYTSVYADYGHENINVKFGVETESIYIIRVFDVLGKLYKELTVQGIKGLNSVDIDVSGMNKGIYFIAINSGNDAITKKVVY